MYMTKLSGVGALFLLIAACGGAPTTETTSTDEISTDALTAAFCRGPNDTTNCQANEACLAINETQFVCTANRCVTQDDCRDGHVCRLNRCIRVEPDPVLPCPRGSVEGRAQCPAGSHAVLISKEPICSSCERDPPSQDDRCGPNYHPVARGTCP
jgi:hypothetical protein